MRSRGIQLGKEAGSRDIQGIRKAEQRQHGNIMPPQFDLAEISIPQTHSGGESPLGESLRLTSLADGRTQKLEGRVRVRCPGSHGIPIEESMEHVVSNGATGISGPEA
jgi:hypothetical protein